MALTVFLVAATVTCTPKIVDSDTLEIGSTTGRLHEVELIAED